MYLWCLGWADHAPVSVVQLARPGQLPVATDGGVESAQVRECRRKRQPIQYLHMREKEGGESVMQKEGRKKQARSHVHIYTKPQTKWSSPVTLQPGSGGPSSGLPSSPWPVSI